MLFCVIIGKIIWVLFSSHNFPLFSLVDTGQLNIQWEAVQRWIVQSSRVRRYEISTIRMGMETRSNTHDRMAMMPNLLARRENSTARCGSVASSACWANQRMHESHQICLTGWMDATPMKTPSAPWLNIWEPCSRCRRARRWCCRWPASCGSCRCRRRRRPFRWWRDSGCSAPHPSLEAGWDGPPQLPFPSSAAEPTWLQVTGMWFSLVKAGRRWWPVLLFGFSFTFKKKSWRGLNLQKSSGIIVLVIKPEQWWFNQASN